MGGVYGTFLEAFSELFVRIEYWEQLPRSSAGWEPDKVKGFVKVVFQDDCGGAIKQFGQVNDVRDDESMWSTREIPLGVFFRRYGYMYRVVEKYDFSKEGGFYQYRIEKLTGDNGLQERKLEIKKGVF